MTWDHVRKALVVTSLYYERQPNSDVIEMQISDFVMLNYQPDLVLKALARYRLESKVPRPPTLADLRTYLDPVPLDAKDLAREISSRIIGAVPKFGYYQSTEAKAFVGPEGWDAIQKCGGWAYICENLGLRLNPSTFQAQIRDLLEANLKHPKALIDHAVQHGLREGNSSLKQLPQLKSINPEEE